MKKAMKKSVLNRVIAVLKFPHHVLVNIVGDHENVVLLAEVGDFFDLGPSENFTEWIVRVVEDDCLRLWVEERLQFGRIQFPVGRTHHFAFLTWLQKKYVNFFTVLY